jgi:3-hydroxyacyl-CoA dehydrogenase / enoyl-CoA hydratase / 3-hydroxybutyryl-CoA epimerase
MTGYEHPETGEIGLAAFVKRADELAATYGSTFEATPYLRDLASSGGSFPA